MARLAARVRKFPVIRRSGRVGSGDVRNIAGRVDSVGLTRVGPGGVQNIMGRVG